MTDELFISRLDELIVYYGRLFEATGKVAADARDRSYFEGIREGLRRARYEFNKETP